MTAKSKTFNGKKIYFSVKQGRWQYEGNNKPLDKWHITQEMKKLWRLLSKK